MRKVLVIALVVALALALTVPAAALTLTDGQKAELEGLYRQMHELRQQIFEKRVESGLISPEDAERHQERMEERWEAMQQRMAENNYEMGFGKSGSRNRLQAGTTGAEL
jgi:TPP-dependent indolepyruvate ferredoxin oxidoreductase alpha subunit